MIQGTTANGLAHFLTDPEEAAIERTIARLEAIYEDRSSGHTEPENSEAMLLHEELELLNAIRAGLGRSPSGGDEGESVN